jgi:hypothetical protein
MGVLCFTDREGRFLGCDFVSAEFGEEQIDRIGSFVFNHYSERQFTDDISRRRTYYQTGTFIAYLMENVRLFVEEKNGGTVI